MNVHNSKNKNSVFEDKFIDSILYRKHFCPSKKLYTFTGTKDRKVHCRVCLTTSTEDVSKNSNKDALEKNLVFEISNIIILRSEDFYQKLPFDFLGIVDFECMNEILSNINFGKKTTVIY